MKLCIVIAGIAVLAMIALDASHVRAQTIVSSQDNSGVVIERAQLLQTYSHGRALTLEEAIQLVEANTPVILERALALQRDTRERELTIEEALQKVRATLPLVVERAQLLQTYSRGRALTLEEAIQLVEANTPVILERALALQRDTRGRELTIEEAIQKVRETLENIGRNFDERRSPQIRPKEAAAISAAQSSGKFRYNEKTGACENALGQPGLNTVTLEELQKTKNGECAALGGIQLNGENLGYPELKNWNLRGADLNKARLFFALLIDADLKGARMGGFDFGYARITGLVDRFTELPQTGCSPKPQNQVECWG